MKQLYIFLNKLNNNQSGQMIIIKKLTTKLIIDIIYFLYFKNYLLDVVIYEKHIIIFFKPSLRFIVEGPFKTNFFNIKCNNLYDILILSSNGITLFNDNLKYFQIYRNIIFKIYLV